MANMPRTATILFVLFVTAALLAQQDTRNDATQRTLQGCLSATPQGSYRLAEDEDGAIHDLAGNPDDLRMLVGNDVLLTGYETPETDTPPSKNAAADPEIQDETGDSPRIGGQSDGSSAKHSFRVVNAIRVSDLCVFTNHRVTSGALPSP